MAIMFRTTLIFEWYVFQPFLIFQDDKLWHSWKVSSVYHFYFAVNCPPQAVRPGYESVTELITFVLYKVLWLQ